MSDGSELIGGKDDNMNGQIPTDDEDQALVNGALALIRENRENERKLRVEVVRGNLKIAEFVFERMLHGNEELARKNSRNKPASYRKLCQHPEMTLSRSTLNARVNVYIQEKFCKGKNVLLEDFSWTDRLNLLPMDNNDKKLEFIKEAIRNKLKGSALKKKVKEFCLAEKGLPSAEATEQAKSKLPPVSSSNESKISETIRTATERGLKQPNMRWDKKSVGILMKGIQGKIQVLPSPRKIEKMTIDDVRNSNGRANEIFKDLVALTVQVAFFIELSEETIDKKESAEPVTEGTVTSLLTKKPLTESEVKRRTEADRLSLHGETEPPPEHVEPVETESTQDGAEPAEPISKPPMENLA